MTTLQTAFVYTSFLAALAISAQAEALISDLTVNGATNANGRTVAAMHTNTPLPSLKDEAPIAITAATATAARTNGGTVNSVQVQPATDVENDFEVGFAGWQSERAGAGAAVLSHGSNAPYAGRHFLCVQTPGVSGGEGATKTFMVEPLHRYRISVMARGQGQVVLGAATARGWISGERTCLNGDWQRLEISHFARSAAVRLNVVTHGTQKTEIHLDNLQIECRQVPAWPELPVAGIKFEAEAFASNSKIVEDAQASGGAYREGARNYWLASDVPFPRTGLPVYIYLKARLADITRNNKLEIRYAGPGIESLFEVAPSVAGQWEWLRTGPFLPGELTDTFHVHHGGRNGAPDIQSRLDCVVVSTHADLPAAVLENMVVPRSSDRGLVSAGYARQAPVLDGRLDDAAWDNAIELGPFLSVGQNKFAEEDTRAYLAHDATNLYVAFHNTQFALDPVNNILHEFRRNVTNHNVPGIWRDDFVVILLSPDGATTYDFFINANGAINAGRGAGATPWETRDSGWESGARAVAGIYNGYWVVEAALPLAALGGQPAAGGTWRIGLGRQSQHKAESSGWTAFPSGFHHPTNFGALAFGRDVPKVRGLRPGNMTLGANELTFEATPPQGKAIPLLVESVVTAPDGQLVKKRSDQLLSKTATLKHGYSLADAGAVALNYTLMNASDFEVYYRSPEYHATIYSSRVEVDGATGADFRLYLNGQELKDGAPLYPGANVLALETTGPFTGAFRVGAQTFSSAGGWRYAAEGDAGWQETAYDDSGWKVVGSASDGRIGKTGEKGCYRRTLLFDHSRFWPNWDQGGVSIAGGSLQQFYFIPQGIKGRRLEDYTLVLEMPEEFSIAGASGYYQRMNVTTVAAGTRRRGDRNYTVHRIALGKKEQQGGVHSGMVFPIAYQPDIRRWQMCAIAVSLPAGRLTPGESVEFHYSIEADGGSVVEIPRTMRVNVLPDVRGKQPATYAWMMWMGWDSSMDDHELAERIIASLADYGFNLLTWPRPIPKHIPMKSNHAFHFYIIDLAPYLEANPEHAFMDLQGQRVHGRKERPSNLICTTRLLEDKGAWDYVTGRIVEEIKQSQPDAIDWDFEFGPFKGAYINCFCPLCQERFREFAGLPAESGLTTQIVANLRAAHKLGVSSKEDLARIEGLDGKVTEYFGQWVDFMCRRQADIADKLNRTIKGINPKIKFDVYSGYQGETAWHYGIDWRYLAGKIDYAICGYGRQPDLIRHTLAALGDTPLVASHILYPYGDESRMSPTCASQATLLRRAVDGTGGIMLYMLGTLDGRTFYNSAEISRLVADYEPLFIAHNRRDELAEATGLGRDNVVVLTKDETRLVMLINESGADQDVSVVNRELPAGAVVSDYYAQKIVENPGLINTVVPAGGVKVFAVSPENVANQKKKEAK
ncbi:MAG: hypothetical protein ABIH24_07090 [Verrucomicrobiota bacterium]